MRGELRVIYFFEDQHCRETVFQLTCSCQTIKVLSKVCQKGKEHSVEQTNLNDARVKGSEQPFLVGFFFWKSKESTRN